MKYVEHGNPFFQHDQFEQLTLISLVSLSCMNIKNVTNYNIDLHEYDTIGSAIARRKLVSHFIIS